MLRVCASCEWIFRILSENKTNECPKCGFGHYSARYVYGQKAYVFAKTQEPWVNKKLNEYHQKLLAEINSDKESEK